MRLPLVRAGQSEPCDVVDLQPSKVVAVGRNYLAHARELGHEMPDEPVIFLKAPSALLAPGEAILRPMSHERVDYEGELAVVIGKRARAVKANDAMEFVLGLTCANDVTVRTLQKPSGPWGRAKGFDTFCPLGPRIVSGLSPADLALTTRLNGTTVQSARTSDVAFAVPFLLEFISAEMTLLPGDVVLTGTPAGVGNVVPGDVVEVEIEGIGVLENPVAAR